MPRTQSSVEDRLEQLERTETFPSPPDFAEHAQQIAAEDLVDLLAVITAVEQFLRDIGIAGHVFELSRRHADAVVIRAESHVVDAGDR